MATSDDSLKIGADTEAAIDAALAGVMGEDDDDSSEQEPAPTDSISDEADQPDSDDKPADADGDDAEDDADSDEGGDGSEASEAQDAPAPTLSVEDRRDAVARALANGYTRDEVRQAFADDPQAAYEWYSALPADAPATAEPGDPLGVKPKPAPDHAEQIRKQLEQIGVKEDNPAHDAITEYTKQVMDKAAQQTEQTLARLEPMLRRGALASLQETDFPALSDKTTREQVNAKIDSILQSNDAAKHGGYDALVRHAVEQVTASREAQQASINKAADSQRKNRGQPTGALNSQRADKPKPMTRDQLQEATIRMAVEGKTTKEIDDFVQTMRESGRITG